MRLWDGIWKFRCCVGILCPANGQLLNCWGLCTYICKRIAVKPLIQYLILWLSEIKKHSRVQGRHHMPTAKHPMPDCRQMRRSVLSHWLVSWLVKSKTTCFGSGYWLTERCVKPSDRILCHFETHNDVLIWSCCSCLRGLDLLGQLVGVAIMVSEGWYFYGSLHS